MKGPVLATVPSREVLALATTGALAADAIHSLSQPLGVIGLAVYNMQPHAQPKAASLDYLRTTLATTEDQIDKAIDLIRGFQGLRARLLAAAAPAPLGATVEQAIALCRPALESSNLEAASTADGVSGLEVSDGPLALAIGINMILYATAALPVGDQAEPPVRKQLRLVCSRGADQATIVLQAANGVSGFQGHARNSDRMQAHADIIAALAKHAKASFKAKTMQNADAIVAVSLPCRP